MYPYEEVNFSQKLGQNVAIPIIHKTGDFPVSCQELSLTACVFDPRLPVATLLFISFLLLEPQNAAQSMLAMNVQI